MRFAFNLLGTELFSIEIHSLTFLSALLGDEGSVVSTPVAFGFGSPDEIEYDGDDE